MKQAISLILVVVLVYVSDALSHAPPRIDPETNYDVVRAVYMSCGNRHALGLFLRLFRCYFVNTRSAFVLRTSVDSHDALVRPTSLERVPPLLHPPPHLLVEMNARAHARTHARTRAHTHMHTSFCVL